MKKKQILGVLLCALFHFVVGVSLYLCFYAAVFKAHPDEIPRPGYQLHIPTPGELYAVDAWEHVMAVWWVPESFVHSYLTKTFHYGIRDGLLVVTSMIWGVLFWMLFGYLQSRRKKAA